MYHLTKMQKVNFEWENGLYGILGLGGIPSQVHSPIAHEPIIWERRDQVWYCVLFHDKSSARFLMCKV